MSHISSRAGRVDHGGDYFADLETRAVEGMKLLVSDEARIGGQVSGCCSF